MRSPNKSAIRPATAADTEALGSLFSAVDLFTPDELVELGDLLDSYFAGALGGDHYWIVYADERNLTGAAYYAPEESVRSASPDTWNLFFIGVLPERQGKGQGTALVNYVETLLAARGARFLIAETSGQASLHLTRAFYTNLKYQEVGRVRDFYKAGDDKVVFRKALNEAARNVEPTRKREPCPTVKNR